MKYLLASLYVLALFPGSLLAQSANPGPDAIQREVVAVERSFAQTMADRDFDAFGKFLAEEAVFFSGAEPLRGKPRVLEAWQTYFEGPDASFSWQPETVEVLESGGLAFSSGPVFDPGGQRVATFHSVWRLAENGEWKIVFDKGSRFCE